MNIFDELHPIGSVFLTVKKEPPKIGMWIFVSENRYIKLTAGDVAFQEGGSASHKHGTKSHTLTTSEMPSHNHTFYGTSYKNGWPNGGQDRITDFQTKRNYWCTYGDSATYTPPPARNSSVSSASNAKPGFDYIGGGSSHTHGDTGYTSPEPKNVTVFMYYRIN